MGTPSEQKFVYRGGRLVVEGGALPPSLSVPRRNEPCSCDSGKKFKKCCWLRTIPPSSYKPRLLVVGAGASIEECHRTGKAPDDPLPSIKNFAAKVFQESHALEAVAASYLDSHGIPYDRAVLDTYESGEDGRPFPEGAFARGPLRTFVRLEADDWEHHNVETLFEHAWITFGNSPEAWDDIVYNGVYFLLFMAFTKQFGFGPARTLPAFQAGTAVAERLFAGDRVISLNYDISFDLALQQARKIFSYAPNAERDSIVVHKPHGSFNLYVCRELGQWGFGNPSLLPGSISIQHGGGVWSPSSGILPPRLNKQYAQHPIAEQILESLQTFKPAVLTFWGVGMTTSDIDLLDVYRRAADSAERVEFINPEAGAAKYAEKVLGRPVRQYWPLKEWLDEAVR